MLKPNQLSFLNRNDHPQRQAESKYLAKLLGSENHVSGRYVIGRNQEATQVIENFKIDAVIDDGAEAGEYYMGLPLVPAAGIAPDSIIVNCSTSVSPVLVEKNLRAIGLKNIIPYHFLMEPHGKLSIPWFVSDQQADVAKHTEEWEDMYLSLGDSESKKVFADIVGFRLTADYSYMQDYGVRIQQQYFEDFLNLNGEIFIDAGGFDGDTTEEFCRRDPAYRKVYFFEPSATNMGQAKQRLHNQDRINYIQKGVSDRHEFVSFDGADGSASKITEAGEGQIELVRIDEAVNEPISFLKMDLEGWEIRALEGAKELIAACKPKMAIAVYHQASDFRDVYRFIKNLNPDYRVFLRHYTQGWSETIMFFIPEPDSN